MRAFVFPGQGSQAVGMGRELAESFAEARDVFAAVDEALGQNLFRLMTEGPDTDLNLTENTQPALMAVSVAVMRVLEKQGGIDLATAASYVAGHSLGEYSALTAARALTLEDCARLLRIRGQAMQKAVPVGEGAMAAILGLDLPDVQAVAEEASTGALVCESANDNAPGQIVVSGHKAAVEAAVSLASARGAKKAILLPVSAPFHCRLMEPAAQVMAEALAAVTISAPVVPVVANVSVQPETDPARIRDLLVRQITGRVRWRESVHWMKEQGVTEMIELGSGKVLCGLIRRIESDVATANAGTPAEVEALITRIKG